MSFEERNKKISIALKGKTPKNITTIAGWNKGLTGEKMWWARKKGEFHLSEESKKKISNSKKGSIAWNKGLTKLTDERVKKYSDKKIGILRPDVAGNKNPNWTGDNEAHFDRRFHYQARKVLERKYNKRWTELFIPKDSVIHHIDHNYKNNSFENLCVMTRAEHTKYHIGGEF